MKTTTLLKTLAATLSVAFIGTSVFAQNFGLAVSLGGAGTEHGNAITVDNAGNIYTTGYFTGSADFDPGPNEYILVSNGESDIFISKLDDAGNFLWAKQIGGIGYDGGLSITVDDEGNILYMGYFAETVDFDPQSGTSYLSGGAGFISKLDPLGEFIWARSLGVWPNSIAVDGFGNVLITGSYNGTVDFDPGVGTFNMTSINNSQDVFVSKFDTNGDFVWAISMGGPDYDNPESIAVDNVGNVHITGNFRGSGDFNPSSEFEYLTSAAGQDIFVVKLASSGGFLWAHRMGGAGEFDDGRGIVLDSDGNVYVTGSFEGTADFDPSLNFYPLTSVGDLDMYVSKFDASGGFLWAQGLGGISSDYGHAISVSPTGNIYVVGSFYGQINYGVYEIISVAWSDVFITEFDSNGNIAWVKQIGGTGFDASFGIATDELGNVYTTGYFSETADFDPSPTVFNLSSAGGDDAFISKLEPESVGILGQNDAPLFSVYPNPSSALFRVSVMDIRQPLQYSLTDNLGRTIATGFIQGASVLDLSEFPSGVYSISVQFPDSQLRSSKLIKF